MVGTTIHNNPVHNFKPPDFREPYNIGSVHVPQFLMTVIKFSNHHIIWDHIQGIGLEPIFTTVLL